MPRVSVLAIILIVLAVLVIVMLVGGYVVARRRANRPDRVEHIAHADQALEQARAADRGWDRDLLYEAARQAIADRAELHGAELELVLVDDRPGVTEDRAHIMASTAGERVRVVLARDATGAWKPDKIQ